MKTRTILVALTLGASLNAVAQNYSVPIKHFAAYKTVNTASDNVHSDKENLFLSGRDLEIAENKSRKTFAELTNLGEGFWVEEQPFQARLEPIAESSPKPIIKVNKYQNSLFFAQWTALSRFLEQDPFFFKK
jgi:hypothetical protein